MSFIAAAAIIGGTALAGGALSAYGASQAARSQNRGADAARRLYLQQTNQGMVRNALAAMGSGGIDYLRANMDPVEFRQLFGRSAVDQQRTQSRMNEIQARLDAIGKTDRSKMSKADKDALASEKARIKTEYNNLRDDLKLGEGSFDADQIRSQYAGQRGYIGEAEDQARRATEALGSTLSGYNADTDRLLGQSQADLEALRTHGLSNLGMLRKENLDLMNTAKQWGKGREDIIRQDYESAMKEADANAMSGMIGSGLGGSTLLANARSSNARNLAYAKQSSLQDLADRQLQAVMGVQASGNAAMAQQRSGNLQSLAQQRALNAQTMGARLGGRTALETANAQQAFQYGLVGPQMRQSFATGNVMNPWLGHNTSQYFPGMSATGSALSTIGNTIGQAGGAIGGMMALGSMFPGGAGTGAPAMGGGGPGRFAGQLDLTGARVQF